MSDGITISSNYRNYGTMAPEGFTWRDGYAMPIEQEFTNPADTTLCDQHLDTEHGDAHIETKCKECEAPVSIDGMAITDTHIDLSQAKNIECPQCGCKWVSVRVLLTSYSDGNIINSEETPA